MKIDVGGGGEVLGDESNENLAGVEKELTGYVVSRWFCERGFLGFSEG